MLQTASQRCQIGRNSINIHLNYQKVCLNSGYKEKFLSFQSERQCETKSSRIFHFPVLDEQMIVDVLEFQVKFHTTWIAQEINMFSVMFQRKPVKVRQENGLRKSSWIKIQRKLHGGKWEEELGKPSESENLSREEDTSWQVNRAN